MSRWVRQRSVNPLHSVMHVTKTREKVQMHLQFIFYNSAGIIWAIKI